MQFDCALLMRGIRHVWRAKEDLCCPVEGVVPTLQPQVVGAHAAPMVQEVAAP